MPLEVGTFINDLTETWPTGTDFKSVGDDHLRLLKTILKTTFPNATKAFRFPTTVAVAGNASILSSQQHAFVVVDATSAPVALTLPALTAGDAGWFCHVSRTAGNNNVTVTPSAGQVNGAANTVLSTTYEIVMFLWTGSTWIRHTVPAIVAATASQYRALTAGLYITTDSIRDASVPTELGNLSGSVTVDLRDGVNFKGTLVGNTTITFTNWASVGGRTGYLHLLQDGSGNRNINFAVSGGAVRYPDQTKPSQTQTPNRWNTWSYSTTGGSLGGNILVQLPFRGWA